MKQIRGKIVILGDDVDTDQILPGYAMAEPMDQLGRFAMAGLPDADKRKQITEGTILVAGRNFGCGSSREQAPTALKQVGVCLIVAQGFARIFRRNAINIGLPVAKIESADGLTDNDEISVDLETGEVQIHKSAKMANLSVQPLSDHVRKTLEYGGLIPRIRAEIAQKEMGRGV